MMSLAAVEALLDKPAVAPGGSKTVLAEAARLLLLS